jgi:hypothetical protein
MRAVITHTVKAFRLRQILIIIRHKKAFEITSCYQKLQSLDYTHITHLYKASGFTGA